MADTDDRLDAVRDAMAPILREAREKLFPVTAMAPVFERTAEALVPLFQQAGEAAKKSTEYLWFMVARVVRRQTPKKVCAWCTGRRPRPATHIVKWPETVTVEDLDGEAVTWVPPRRQRMCQFHMGHAIRYWGVRAYRFRTLR